VCYIQSLLINTENTFFDLSICAEKKFDTNIFKKKNLKIEDFKEIFGIIITNYNMVNSYLEKFLNKLNSLTETINHEINIKKIYNTMLIQYNKLLLEKEKIFNLINQTNTFYYDIAMEYLQTPEHFNSEIFLKSPRT
jgi:hypothetical protein